MTKVTLAFMVAAASLGIAIAPAGEAGAAATSVLHALTPCRLIDTRDPGIPTPAPDSTTPVPAAGRCGVPADATAVAVTVTAASAHSDGYVTVWADGQVRPDASLLNYGPGATVANSGIFQVGTGGGLNLYTFARTDLIVDVTAYFTAASEAAAGRFVPLPQRRLVDTRNGGRPAPGTAITVVAPSIPADATAVAVNLTTTQSTGPGWFGAYASGSPRPVASVLNVDGSGQTRAASAIVPVADRTFDVFSSGGDHVIVDIAGYFTGSSATVADDGLFVAVRPVRLLDTRAADGPRGGPRVHTAGEREIDTFSVTGHGGAALAANVTVTSTLSAGWWRLGPSGIPGDLVSTVNADAARQTIANSAIASITTRGVAIHASVSADVVVDATGWFTGTPTTATLPPPRNDAPYRRVTIIGDSAMAGLRWNGAYGGLQGFEADPRLESCRRLVYPSCNGREGYNPLTAWSHIHWLPEPTTDDILVIAVGYNDWDSRFSGDFDAVIGAARAKGFENIAWVSYRESELYRLPGDVPIQFASYAVMNRIVREKLASGAFPDVEIWDLHGYTLGAWSWFTSDGVHQTVLGSWGVADWISRQVAAFDAKPCPQPWRPGWAPDAPCPDPDGVPPVLGHPYIAQLYPRAS